MLVSPLRFHHAEFSDMNLIGSHHRCVIHQGTLSTKEHSTHVYVSTKIDSDMFQWCCHHYVDTMHVKAITRTTTTTT